MQVNTAARKEFTESTALQSQGAIGRAEMELAQGMEFDADQLGFESVGRGALPALGCLNFGSAGLVDDWPQAHASSAISKSSSSKKRKASPGSPSLSSLAQQQSSPASKSVARPGTAAAAAKVDDATLHKKRTAGTMILEKRQRLEELNAGLKEHHPKSKLKTNMEQLLSRLGDDEDVKAMDCPAALESYQAAVRAAQAYQVSIKSWTLANIDQEHAGMKEALKTLAEEAANVQDYIDTLKTLAKESKGKDSKAKRKQAADFRMVARAFSLGGWGLALAKEVFRGKGWLCFGFDLAPKRKPCVGGLVGGKSLWFQTGSYNQTL